jgi:hypothetical protein
MDIMIVSLLLGFGASFVIMFDEGFTTLPAMKCRIYRLIGILLVFYGTCYGIQTLINARIITP